MNLSPAAPPRTEDLQDNLLQALNLVDLHMKNFLVRLLDQADLIHVISGRSKVLSKPLLAAASAPVAPVLRVTW
jgi:hypothetical protein